MPIQEIDYDPFAEQYVKEKELQKRRNILEVDYDPFVQDEDSPAAAPPKREALQPPASKVGTLGGVASALGQGIAEGVTTALPEMAGEALEFAGTELLGETVAGIGRNLKEWSEAKGKALYGEPKKREGLERWVYEGSKMLAPSVIPAGAVGAGVRILTGVGKLVKAGKAAQAAGDAAKAAEYFDAATKAAKLSNNVASASTAGLFGTSQAQSTRDTAEKQAAKLEAEGDFEGARQAREAGQGWAPYASGAIEAGGEFFGTKYLGKLFRLDEAGVAKRGAKQLVNDFLKTLGVEVGTEMGQQGGEAYVEKVSGIRPDADPLAEALDVVGPTAFMTLLTGGMAGAVNRMRQPSDSIDLMEEEKDQPDLTEPIRQAIEQEKKAAAKAKPRPSTAREAAETFFGKEAVENEQAIESLRRRGLYVPEDQPVAPSAEESARVFEEEQARQQGEAVRAAAPPSRVAMPIGEPQLGVRPEAKAVPEEIVPTGTSAGTTGTIAEMPLFEPETEIERIDQAGNAAATSPLNERPQPTEAQKQAGNYAKGHISYKGLDISIENPRGSERSGTDKAGKPWSIVMEHPYGYIRGTQGRDKDHLDVFIGPDTESDKAFVVDQINPETGKWDEHKILMGFNTEEEARKGYLDNYQEGWKGLGAITEMPVDEFKAWAKSGPKTKPLAYKEADRAEKVRGDQGPAIREEKGGVEEAAPGTGVVLGGEKETVRSEPVLGGENLQLTKGTEREAGNRKGLTPPAEKPTFREFIEAKGLKWPVKTSDPQYAALKEEYDRGPSETPVKKEKPPEAPVIPPAVEKAPPAHAGEAVAPKTVYRGTERGRSGEWYTPDKEAATEYANLHEIGDVEQRIFDKGNFAEPNDIIAAAKKLGIDTDKESAYGLVSDQYPEVLTALKGKGFDGVHLPEGEDFAPSGKAIESYRIFEKAAPKTKGFDPDNDRQRQIFVAEILKSESPEVRAMMKQAEEAWPGEDPGPVVESQIDYDLQKAPEKWLNTEAGKEIIARKGWGEKATQPEPERAEAKAWTGTVYRGSETEGIQSTSEEGVFFTDSKEAAETYGKARPYSLTMKNPLTLDAGGKDWQAGFTIDGELMYRNEIVEKARKDGHDGVIVKNVLDYGDAPKGSEAKPHNVYIAFDPAQAKESKPPSPEKVSEEVKSLILHDMRTALEEGFDYGMREEDELVTGEGTNKVYIGTSNPEWLWDDIMLAMKRKHKQTVTKKEIIAVIKRELAGHDFSPKQMKIWFFLEDKIKEMAQRPHYIRAAEVMSGAKDALIADYNEGADIGQYHDSDLEFPPTQKEVAQAAAEMVGEEYAKGNTDRLQTYQAERGEARKEENEAPAAETGPAEEVNPGTTFYHGTSAKDDFASFKGDVVYLSENPDEAKAFAENPILGGSRGTGKPRTLKITAKGGKVKNINDTVQNVVMEDDDLDAAIAAEAKQARKEGYRYLSFEHPSTVEGVDEFTAKISLYPQDDLKIEQEPTPKTEPTKAGTQGVIPGASEAETFMLTGAPGEIGTPATKGAKQETASLEEVAEKKQPPAKQPWEMQKKDFIKDSELSVINNEKEGPKPNKYKEGDLAIDDYGENPYVYQMQYLDPQKIEFGLEGETRQRVIDMPSTQKYIEWSKQGIEPSPITVVLQGDKKTPYSTNRRRVIAAQESGAKKIPAFVEIGRHKDMIQQAVSDGLPVPQAVLDEYPELKPRPSPTEDAGEKGKIEDFGEKVGGARKDTAERGYSMSGKVKKEDEGPAWRKKFVAMEKVHEPGKWVIGNAGAAKAGIITRFGGQVFSSQEEAEKAIPLYAVAQNHSVYQNDDKTYSIYKRVSDRKRLKVVNKDFPSREEAMKHMALHAEDLLNLKTNFGEEILPVPEIAVRKGEERRTKDATPEMFMETFQPRGIEFGNWNNQEERQQVMNHAYDGLLDLADALGLPPKALMLNGELAIAFGARGQGLTGAKAHYETDYGIINLTKMKGAGSLGHEFFHALDHYLGRQDTPERGKRVPNKRGDMVFPTSLSDKEYASSGLRVTDSGVRKELKDAFESLLQSMYKRAEQYVEDTKQADKFLGTARKNLSDMLNNIRGDLARDMTNYHKSKGGYSNKPIKFFEPASTEQLAEFDRLANILVEGGDLETKFMSTDPAPGEPVLKRFGKARPGAFNGRYTNDTLESLNAIIKAARNHQGFNKEQTGSLDKVRAAMGTYKARIKMFEDAQAGTEKTRMRPTSYAIEAKKMDQARASNYWSDPKEMAARAFAAYVEDKIAEKGGQSDFLVYHAHGGIILPMIDGFIARPYPEGAEREAINKEFDKFISTIETRETPQGVEMYEVRDAIRSNASFSEQLDDFAAGKIVNRREPITVGKTPAVLEMLGAEQVPLVITQGTVEKATSDKHGISIETLKKLPAAIEDPIMVFESATEADSLVVMTELRQDGKSIVAAVRLSKDIDKNVVNDIISVHPRNSEYHFINWINQGLLRYQNKQKSRAWSLTSGLQLPGVSGTVRGVKNKIRFSHDLVKWVNEHPQEKASVRDQHRRGLLKPAKLDDVKRFFPGQEVGNDRDGNIYVKTRGGAYVTIYKVDHIKANPDVLTVGYGVSNLKPGQVIPGAMGVTPSGEYYIKLHRVFGDVWTMAHEGLGHFLESAKVINSRDVDVLKNHIKNLHRDGRWDPANRKDIGGPEDRANFIADRLAIPEQRGPIGRIILRIRAFIDGILETFGVRSPEGIVRGIESGKIFERTGREGKGGERYAPAQKSILERMLKDKDFIQELNARAVEYIREDEVLTPEFVLARAKELIEDFHEGGHDRGDDLSGYNGEEAQKVARQEYAATKRFIKKYESLVKKGEQYAPAIIPRSLAPMVDSIVQPGILSRAWDEFRYQAQDKFHFLNKAQIEAERRSRAALPESQDAYLAETRYHGMAAAAIEDFDEKHIDPLVELMSENDISVEQADEYLHARHAQEANARLREINPDREDNQALSGMSDEEARRILERVESGPKARAFKEIARRIDAITKARRDLLIEAGLETEDTIAAWEEAYQYYVPLMREGKGAAMPRKGRGFEVRGGQKLRAGSTREVVNILANVVAQHEATIVRAEKAKVSRAFLEFAKTHRGPWKIDVPEKTASYDEDGLIQYRANPLGYMLADNVLAVRVDGKDHHITFDERDLNGMKILSALKNLDAADMGAVTRAVAKISRWLAVINTSLNPEFIISNFARDIQTAAYNMADNEADAIRMKAIKQVGSAFKGIREYQDNNRDTEWARWFNRFRNAGGQTGWIQSYESMQDRENALIKKIRDMHPSRARTIKRGLTAAFDYIADMNTAIENGIRLSVFKNLVEANVPESKAAKIAKELTVNFNRKGNMGPVLNAFYLFYNASIQGSARLIAAGVKSRKVRYMMGATIVFAAALDLMNRAIGGDDDDGENRYDKIAPWIKDRNMIIMLPGSGGHLQIPLPWGYNVFHVMGQAAGEVLTKKNNKATDSALRVGGAIVSAFNPMGGEASLLQVVSPTILDPFVQWAENKDWSGRKIRPSSNPFAEKPSSQTYWHSVREPSKWVANFLNEITGGDQVRPGKIDWSPEAIDLAIDTVTGGAGKFVSNLISTPIKYAKGEDVETYEIPFLRRVYGKAGKQVLTSQYYENMDTVRLVQRQLSHYKNDPAKVREIVKENRDEVRLIARMKATQKVMKDLRDQLKAAENIKDKEIRTAREKKIEETMEKIMKNFNRNYNTVKEKEK